jgi:hypothetical protein
MVMEHTRDAGSADEGVIKFKAEHVHAPLVGEHYDRGVQHLAAWRLILARAKLLGQASDRYGGLAYGNLSARVPPFPGERQRRRFVITGTQTSGKHAVTRSDFCLVEAYDFERNAVRSHGLVLPSSEALTHGAVYDLNPSIRFVLHVHAPRIWRRAAPLGLPQTCPRAVCGTVAMAREVFRLLRESSLANQRLFVMAGHEDGVVSFGRSAAEAAEAVLQTLARAYTLDFRDTGSLSG